MAIYLTWLILARGGGGGGHRQPHSSQGGDRCGPVRIRLQRGDQQFEAVEVSGEEQGGISIPHDLLAAAG